MKRAFDIRNEERIKVFKSDISNGKAMTEKIKDAYFYEYCELISDMLLIDEKKFMNLLTSKVLESLAQDYSDSTGKNNIIIDTCQICESTIHASQYAKDSKIIYSAWEEYKTNLEALESTSNRISKKNVDNLSYLVSFIPHCSSTESIAVHTCGSKLIEVRDSIRPNCLLFLICIGCKCVNTPNSIKLKCTACSLPYFTKYLSEGEKKEEWVAATWEKYHCNNLINDCMHCLKCNEILYFNKQTGILKCLKCNFQIKPSNVAWQCLICKLEFKSIPKQYHPIQFKIVRDAIRSAISNRILAKPHSIPCCSTAISREIVHNKDCNGLLYLGELFDKPIIACEKCRAMNYFDKFTWTCPICFKKFRQRNSVASKSEIKPISKNTIVKIKLPIDTKSRNMKYDTQAENYFSTGERPMKLGTITDEDLKEMRKFEQSKSSACLLASTSGSSGKLPAFKPKNLIDILDNRKSKKNLRSTSSDKIEEVIMKPANESNVDQQKFFGKKISRKNLGFIDSSISVMINTSNSSKKEIGIKAFIPRGSSNFEIRSNSRKNLINIDLDNTDPSETETFDLSNKANKENSRNDKLEEFKSTNKPQQQNNQVKALHVQEEDKSAIEFGKLDDNKHSKLPIEEKYEKQAEKACLKQNSNSKEFNINDYKVIQQIGEGTYGKIYMVTDKQGCKFAMKKIICHKRSELRFTKREFNLVDSNAHPNIIRIEGIAEKELDSTTFALYILLEIADSDWEIEVSKRFKTLNYYSENELISILTQLTSCLVFLQQKKIAHRDIKPQNILVFGGNTFKLADFGEAKQNTMNKQTNTLRGTELYMSPLLFDKLKEEIRTLGPDNTTPQDVKHNIYKSDVFSLGYCMIYAGSLTFDSISDLRETDSSDQIEQKIRKYFNNRYSDKFVKLIMKMVSFNEYNRFDFVELSKYLMKY